MHREIPERTHGSSPWIVGIGGTVRPGSSSERALRLALAFVERQGARTEIFPGPQINLPMYSSESTVRNSDSQALINAMRRADGVILASPGYHGSISGLLKNALDYIEDLRNDERPYLDGRAVGLIACAFGWQATGSTLMAMRSIVHALRGWPTPMGVGINTTGKPFNDDGSLVQDGATDQLRIIGQQVVDFARMR